MDKRKAMLIVLFVAMAGITVYYYYPRGGGETATVETGGVDLTVLDQDLQSNLSEYRKIKNLSLDFELLNDPLFKSLQDVEMPPAPSEPLGRPNPFLPF